MAIIVACSKPNISDLPAFHYKLISEEHELVIKEHTLDIVSSIEFYHCNSPHRA